MGWLDVRGILRRSSSLQILMLGPSSRISNPHRVAAPLEPLVVYQSHDLARLPNAHRHGERLNALGAIVVDGVVDFAAEVVV
jgi:hypothetical protein